MKINREERNPGLDVVRCFALFSVIGVHFFKNSNFYDVPINGFGMFLLVLARNFFMICVPLFIILSGHLLGNRQVSMSYYLRLIPILTVYLLASIACSLYRLVFIPNDFSVTGMLAGIFGYYTAPYGWYVGMYIGLFLLIPFLNILYYHIPTKTLKTVFIFSLVFVTAGGSLVNDYFPLFPNYWREMYPITYYFIGCYLAEYPLKLKRHTNALLIGIVIVISGVVSYCQSYGSSFQSNLWQEHGSIITTLQAVLVFHFLAHGNYSRLGKKMRKLLSRISSYCLGAYLVSWIFDNIFYNILNSYQATVLGRSKFFIPVTIAVYVCSLLLSAGLNNIYQLTIKRIVNRLFSSQNMHSF